jgi:hypothetical protein
MGKRKKKKKLLLIFVLLFPCSLLFLLLLFLGHPFGSCIQGSEVLGLPPVIGYFRGLHPLETPSGKAPMTILHRTFLLLNPGA